MAPRRASDVFDEVAELFAQGDQDLVLVLDRLCASQRQVRAQGKGNG